MPWVRALFLPISDADDCASAQRGRSAMLYHGRGPDQVRASLAEITEEEHAPEVGGE